MRNIRPFVAIIIVVGLMLLSGCAYVDVKSPLDVDLDKTTLGEKKGVAEARSVLWLFAWGDASYAAAAADGGITTLRHADQEVFNVLFGLYTRWRVVVYGD
ncbi:TRL domain-containing protein [uncultured Desulfosarcina sp.]|uniref:TRL domain-containing protein n=1 Tax=uncultured Desulfosarcina sp. TaxID=218289 RepID=UPI0029C87ED6|nr:TRL domain-containing protein [uncultured Desulfosarcina sp.]